MLVPKTFIGGLMPDAGSKTFIGGLMPDAGT